MPIRWIDAGRVSALRSQSIYHGLGYAHKADTQDIIVLAIPESPYMCIGHFQDARNELDLEFCKRQNLPIIRRETGGGAVYIDSDQLFVQWVFQRGYLPPKVEHRFQFFLEPLIETYKFFGIKAYYHPINDVHVQGKKIVGSGAGTIGDADVITGNFLFDFDDEIMTDALLVPNSVFKSRVKIALEKYMTSVKKELGFIPEIEEIKQVYFRKCKEHLGVELVKSEFTEDEIHQMELVEMRFQSDDWLFQIKKPSSDERLVKIHAERWIGMMNHKHIRVMTELKGNTIEFIKMEATSNENGALEKLEQELLNTVLIENSVKEIVASVINGEEISDWIEAVMRVKKERQRMTGYE